MRTSRRIKKKKIISVTYPGGPYTLSIRLKNFETESFFSRGTLDEFTVVYQYRSNPMVKLYEEEVKVI